jgi:two-component system LytT family response regulator
VRTLIVDDEPIARRVLREQLELIPAIDIIGEAENGKDAVLQIAQLSPDLIFLDLQMPVMSGFEVIQNIRGLAPPAIIIVTAFDQHAIHAFEAGAIDYLLKPVHASRLIKAVDRAMALRHKPVELANNLAKIAASAEALSPVAARKIVGRHGEEYHLLNTADVLAFQAERELVWIVTARQRLLATQSLSAIQERLRDPQFQRVHRNAIINMNHIRKMTALSSQRWMITLSNSLQVIVSKRQAHNVRQS